jgi:hypothetical protein
MEHNSSSPVTNVLAASTVTTVTSEVTSSQEPSGDGKSSSTVTRTVTTEQSRTQHVTETMSEAVVTITASDMTEEELKAMLAANSVTTVEEKREVG